jgi:hypothetical protein
MQASILDGRVGVEQILIQINVAVRQEATPNVIIHSTLHIALHADGTVTAQVNDITATCQS